MVAKLVFQFAFGQAQVKTPRTEVKKKKGPSTGIGWFMDNPYVDWWPTDRRPINLKHYASQTIDEAAAWCKKDWGLNKNVSMPC